MNSGGIVKIIENTMACHKMSYGKSITITVDNHHYLLIDARWCLQRNDCCLLSPNFQTISIYQKPHNAYNVGPPVMFVGL